MHYWAWMCLLCLPDTLIFANFFFLFKNYPCLPNMPKKIWPKPMPNALKPDPKAPQKAPATSATSTKGQWHKNLTIHDGLTVLFSLIPNPMASLKQVYAIISTPFLIVPLSLTKPLSQKLKKQKKSKLMQAHFEMISQWFWGSLRHKFGQRSCKWAGNRGWMDGLELGLHHCSHTPRNPWNLIKLSSCIFSIMHCHLTMNHIMH